MRQFRGGDTGVMPDRHPAVAQVVRRVVRHLRNGAGACHRLVETCLRDPLENAALGRSVFECACPLDCVDEPLRQRDETHLVALRIRGSEAKAKTSGVDIAPRQGDDFALA